MFPKIGQSIYADDEEAMLTLIEDTSPDLTAFSSAMRSHHVSLRSRLRASVLPRQFSQRLAARGFAGTHSAVDLPVPEHRRGRGRRDCDRHQHSKAVTG